LVNNFPVTYWGIHGKRSHLFDKFHCCFIGDFKVKDLSGEDLTRQDFIWSTTFCAVIGDFKVKDLSGEDLTRQDFIWSTTFCAVIGEFKVEQSH
jgi:hypothetical protein